MSEKTCNVRDKVLWRCRQELLFQVLDFGTLFIYLRPSHNI